MLVEIFQVRDNRVAVLERCRSISTKVKALEALAREYPGERQVIYKIIEHLKREESTCEAIERELARKFSSLTQSVENAFAIHALEIDVERLTRLSRSVSRYLRRIQDRYELYQRSLNHAKQLRAQNPSLFYDILVSYYEGVTKALAFEVSSRKEMVDKIEHLLALKWLE